MQPLSSFARPTSTLAKCSLAFATKCEENQQERFCAPCGLTFQPFSSNFYLVPGHSPSSFKTMSHQFTSGAFFNGEAAWHKLGTVLDGTLPAREAFAIANADWEVLSTPIFDPAGQPIAGYQAISRGDDGKVLSVQKDSYTIVQNEQLIKLAEALHEDASMDAVVVLNEGRKVAFTARINNAEGEVVKNDEINQYLIGCTSHDGSISFQTIFSPIRVVCQNTLSATLNHADRSDATGKNKRMSIRHTANCNALIERLPEIIDFKRQQFTHTLEELQVMASKPCSSVQFQQYCEKVFADQLAGTVNDKRGDKTTARAKTLQDLPAWNGIVAKFHGEGIGSTIKGVEGTMWGAYNAITEHLTHDAGRATSDTVETARKRLESLYWGTGAATLAKAHALALA
jgi:phage/plasmid-like protein (TIGR03299 family)